MNLTGQILSTFSGGHEPWSYAVVCVWGGVVVTFVGGCASGIMHVCASYVHHTCMHYIEFPFDSYFSLQLIL